VAEAAPAPAVGRGGWHVQLGAFGDPGNARKLWGQVSGRFAGASVSYVKSGALTRVLVGPYPSRAAAAAACGAVRPCVPVNP
jgi:cell division septation protein DedD